MNKLEVRKIDFVPLIAEKTKDILDSQNINSNKIDCVNWKSEYPYQPDVEFKIAHDRDNIVVHFIVKENEIKATRMNDNEDVWNDSCVEFFISFNNDSFYYNIEANCIGATLVSVGTSKNDRKHLTNNEVRKIKRYASLGYSTIEGNNSYQEWELSLIIPKEVFILSDIESFSGVQARGNFYKCGDELKTPHFLSWNAINTDSPNFHVPTFFGKINFE